MLKFTRNNRSSSMDRNGTNGNDRISVSSLSPRVKVSSLSPSATSPSTRSARRRSRTSSLERVSMRNSFMNNNAHVVSQYINQNVLSQQNHCEMKSCQQPLKPNFIIPKSSSMFIESIKNHQNMLSNAFDNSNNTHMNLVSQPMSLDSSYHQIQQRDEKSSSQLSSSSVRTANIVNCGNNGSPKNCLPTLSTISPKSIKPILSPPPTPLIPQRSKAQYHNVNSDQNQPELSNNNDLSHEENTCAENGKENPNIKSQFTNAESPDYETVYSGMFCRLLPPPSSSGSKNINTSQSSPVTSLPSVPMTPTLQKLSAAINSNNSVIKLKSVLKKKQSNPTDKNDKSASGKNVGDATNTIVNNSGYDFHRAIEKLVEKMDLQLLDTSSESGYGSDQDSLTSQNSASSTTSPSPLSSSVPTAGIPTITTVPKSSPSVSSPSKPPSLPPRLATSKSCGSSPLPRRAPPPIPSIQTTPQANKDGSKKRRVRFDSYVLFLQGLRERDLELVQIHIRDVCDAALATDEVVAEFLAAVIEGREAIVRECLAFGFSANTTADPTGMTPLHLAAAFNHLPLVRILLAHGAAVFARAHSSGKVASELCSRQLPGYQACHAYLRCMEECLGVANTGKVYSTQAYRTTRCDELGLNSGDELVVIRKGDYNGSSWWWCCNQLGQQGYVLQDFLALNKKSNIQLHNGKQIRTVDNA